MKFLVSLLGLGISGGGVFIGSIQQNVLKTEKPYIDKLFHEIERDIREFSEENPITEEEAEKIKEVQSSRKRRDTESDEKAESKNTLEVWTDIWVGLLGDYIQSLWIGDKKDINASTTLKEEVRHFSDKEKQEAIKYADTQNKEEKERFKQKLSEKTSEIEDIYERMKDFILKIEFPATYKYDRNNNNDGPYENYIRKISQ